MLPPATFRDLEGVFGQVLSVALSLVGLAAIIMLVVGGFKYLSAGGDKEAAAKAKHTLTYAVIGTVLAISAFMILRLLGVFLGADFNNFSLGI